MFPPVAPLGAGQEAIYVVKLIFTATGTVEEYESRQNDFASTLAAYLGIPTQQVSISIHAASVVIDAEIVSPSVSTAQHISETLSSTLASASATADFFGVAVLEAPTVSTLSGVISTPSPPLSPSLDSVGDAITSDEEPVQLGPIIGGAVAGVVMLMAVVGVGFWMRKRAARKNDASSNSPVILGFHSHSMEMADHACTMTKI